MGTFLRSDHGHCPGVRCSKVMMRMLCASANEPVHALMSLVD